MQLAWTPVDVMEEHLQMTSSAARTDQCKADKASKVFDIHQPYEGQSSQNVVCT